ncbi:hypothetical protein ACMZOO_11330 [Catenovulum sp. SX2]|uniref:hypothetical protein n=1 Tax=Catenovulum sp. SX2 TaxID=3398614 RepID=UPI003F85C8F4
MNSEQNNDINQGKSANSSRRKFLQKASAGVALTTIPAKSVWASGGGILNSIAASNHGSGWTNGCMYLLSHGYWKQQGETESKSVLFTTAFGVNSYPEIQAEKLASSSVASADTKGDYQWNGFGELEKCIEENDRGTKTYHWESVDGITKSNITLHGAMTNESIFANVFVQICAMYLNAEYGNSSPNVYGLHFPVYGTGKPFASLSEFATWLYNNATSNKGESFGSALSSLIAGNHVGTSTCQDY